MHQILTGDKNDDHLDMVGKKPNKNGNFKQQKNKKKQKQKKRNL